MNALSSYLKKRFSRSAYTYDKYSKIHQDVAKHLIKHTELPDIESPILEIGAGTGILTSQLLNYYCKNQIVCLDISSTMLKKIKSKIIDLNCIQGDFNSLPFLPSFNFVVSSASLHWADDTDSIIKILHNSLRKNGVFSIAIMLDNTYHLLKKIKKDIGVPVKNSKLPVHNDFIDKLKSSGFTISRAENNFFLEKFNSIEEVFISIHHLGVSGLNIKPLPRGILKSIKNRYLIACMEKYNSPCLEYEVGFYTGRLTGIN